MVKKFANILLVNILLFYHLKGNRFFSFTMIPAIIYRLVSMQRDKELKSIIEKSIIQNLKIKNNLDIMAHGIVQLNFINILKLFNKMKMRYHKT